MLLNDELFLRHFSRLTNYLGHSNFLDHRLGTRNVPGCSNEAKLPQTYEQTNFYHSQKSQKITNGELVELVSGLQPP